MNATTIKKCLDFLDSFNIGELRTTLKTEYMKATSAEPNKKLTLLTAVKKAITNKHEKREALTTVMHDKNGLQFICDGYIAVIFNAYIAELEALPQTDSEKSIDIWRISEGFKAGEENAVTEQERVIIQNIGKYKKIFGKDQKIKLFNHYFSAEYIKKLIDIIGSDFINYKSTFTGIYTETENKTAFICALRPSAIPEQEQNGINEQTEKFYKILTENN